MFKSITYLPVIVVVGVAVSLIAVYQYQYSPGKEVSVDVVSQEGELPPDVCEIDEQGHMVIPLDSPWHPEKDVVEWVEGKGQMIVAEKLDDTPFYVFLYLKLHPDYQDTVYRGASSTRLDQSPQSFSKLGVESLVWDHHSQYFDKFELIASREGERLSYIQADRPNVPSDGLWDVQVWSIRPDAEGVEALVTATYYTPALDESSPRRLHHFREWWHIPSNGDEPTLTARNPEGRDFYGEIVELD